MATGSVTAKPTKYRVKEKLAAVERLLRGKSAERVSRDLSIPVEYLERWQSTFYSTGKRALRYTRDPGEIPRLEDVELIAQRTFPYARFRDCRQAVCFFVAQFFGKNEVIHLNRIGMRDVTLVDLDEEKLPAMREIYPESWTFEVADAFARAKQYAAEGRTFDLVSCDPYTNWARPVAWDHFDDFAAISSRYFITLYTADMLEEIGAEPDAESTQTALRRKLDREVVVADVVRRSSHKDGIFWVLFDVSPAGSG